jgi:hypothetical protein
MCSDRWPAGRPQLDELFPLLAYNSLEFFYGVGESGALLRARLSQETSILLLGRLGSGKTCLAASVLCQLYATNGPEELQVVFLDSGSDLAPLFAGFPQTSAIATRPTQVEAALRQPFQARPPGAPSPFWLVVLDSLSLEDRALYKESHTWSMVEALPLRFDREAQTGLRGGLLAISADPHPLTTPFQTTVILAHDRGQIALQRRRQSLEQALLRRLATASAPGQFLIKRRRGARKTEVAGLFLAPEAGLTNPATYLPRVLATYTPPPAE